MASDLNLELEFRREDSSTIGSITRTNLRKWFRDVCVEYFIRNPVKLGREGKIVEIDETVLTRRQYS